MTVSEIIEKLEDAGYEELHPKGLYGEEGRYLCIPKNEPGLTLEELCKNIILPNSKSQGCRKGSWGEIYLGDKHSSQSVNCKFYNGQFYPSAAYLRGRVSFQDAFKGLRPEVKVFSVCYYYQTDRELWYIRTEESPYKKVEVEL